MGKMAIRKLAGAALLLAAVLAVAGCGGGKKSSTPAPPTVTVGATTQATPTTTTPPATQATTTTTTTTASGSGDTSLKNCGSLTTFGQEFSKALAAAGAAGGGGTAGLGAEADAFKTFANKAPAEIRDQLLIIGDALSKYAEALKGVDLKAGQVPSAETLAKLQVAAKEISQPDVAAAGQKISAYVQAHCHA